MRVITGTEKDLGGFQVRRVLPTALQKAVGPFVFFDYIGPAVFKPGHGIDVRPHPHINLATVTYLFEGLIHHRDCLGHSQLITPGAINWMVAGRGIVHSERTPAEIKLKGGPINGIQCWLALPKEDEDCNAYFQHVPSDELPVFHQNQAQLKLLLGSAYGVKSPVKVHSDLFYLEVKLPQGETLILPGAEESALYLISGKVTFDNQEIPPASLAVFPFGKNEVKAEKVSHFMLMGGKNLGKRYIEWNFVSSTMEKIEQAKRDWQDGPILGRRFSPIPDDCEDFIPLPQKAGKPGTIL